MHGLTYGVIRVDSEEKLSVLTVQDVGLVMPGGECGPSLRIAWGVEVGTRLWPLGLSVGPSAVNADAMLTFQL